MSFARFSTDDRSGGVRGYVGDGHFTNDPLETFGGAGVVEIRRIAVAASLHLREGFRTPRRSQSLQCQRRRA